jgi:hypothetical protein
MTNIFISNIFFVWYLDVWSWVTTNVNSMLAVWNSLYFVIPFGNEIRSLGGSLGKKSQLYAYCYRWPRAIIAPQIFCTTCARHTAYTVRYPYRKVEWCSKPSFSMWLSRCYSFAWLFYNQMCIELVLDQRLNLWCYIVCHIFGWRIYLWPNK